MVNKNDFFVCLVDRSIDLKGWEVTLKTLSWEEITPLRARLDVFTSPANLWLGIWPSRRALEQGMAF